MKGATLIDVPRIFVDEEFMRYKVAKVKNPVVRTFWGARIRQYRRQRASGNDSLFLREVWAFHHEQHYAKYHWAG